MHREEFIADNMIKVGYAPGLDGISSCNHTPCSYVTKQVSMQQRVSKSQ